MKRLTERSLDYCTQHCPSEKMISCAFYKDDQAERCLIANMYDRLAAYEDTGLEPEQCAKYAQAEKEGRYIVLKEPRSAGVHRLEEIARADIEGRLAVLPCKAGDTVYVPDYDAVREVHVEAISITETHTFICCTFSCSGWDCPCVFEHFAYTGEEYDCNNYGYIEIPVEEVGKTWFTTREEAEKALKGVSEDA